MKLGGHQSEQTKQKLRLARLGKKLSPEHRKKVIQTLRYGAAFKGAANPRWKGGIVNHGGYICIKMPEHPKAYSNGYVKRAILVAEQVLKRHLTVEEVTHHVNGIKSDDRPENIEVLSASEHNSITMKERWLRGEVPFKRRV